MVKIVKPIKKPLQYWFYGLGKYDPPRENRQKFQFFSNNFLFFWRIKKRTTPSKSVNFCGFFDVYNLYITQKKNFSKNFFTFTWLIKGTILKKFWKFFFKLEDWDRLQTTGNFVLYHVPEFHQDCLSTFLAISISKFQFIRQKSKIFFRGYVRNYLYHL